MATATNRLLSYLDENGVDYQVIHHRLDYTAQRTAADTHTPGREFAKCVLVEVDGEPALVVLPAHHKVDFVKAFDELHARVTLCTEEQVAETFPDCEIGAEPPMGNLYDLPVYVSPDLAREQYITFNAGTHHEAVRIRYEDYATLVRPLTLDLDWRPEAV